MKLGVEEARLLANRDPAREVQLHLEFATKRVWELRPLFTEERLALVGGVTENLRRHTASSIAGLKDVGGTIKGEALRAQVETVLSRQVESLSDLFTRACPGSADDGPAGRVAGGPAEACEDLRGAFRESARALEVVRPMEPVGHQKGGAADRGAKVSDRGPGARGHSRDQKDRGKSGQRKERKGGSGRAERQNHDGDRGDARGGGPGSSGGSGDGLSSDEGSSGKGGQASGKSGDEG
jgi:hypothetical protein